MGIRKTITLDEVEVRRVNAIAMREGILPSQVLRGMISIAADSYEREFGELSIEGISPGPSFTIAPAWGSWARKQLVQRSIRRMRRACGLEACGNDWLPR